MMRRGVKVRAAGLAIATVIALSAFGLGSARAEWRCVAWGGGPSQVPTSADVATQYENVIALLPPEARDVVKAWLYSCTDNGGTPTNPADDKKGMGVNLPVGLPG